MAPAAQEDEQQEGQGGEGEQARPPPNARSRDAARYKTMRFSDGGTVANNPAFIALQVGGISPAN